MNEVILVSCHPLEDHSEFFPQYPSHQLVGFGPGAVGAVGAGDGPVNCFCAFCQCVSEGPEKWREPCRIDHIYV